MAKTSKKKNKNLSPLEELHVQEQERQMEEKRQLHVKQAMQCSRLETVLAEQTVKKLLYYPFVVGCLAVIVLILYWIVQGHCPVDLPLFVIMAALAVACLFFMQRENRRLCGRIEEMLEERRHS